MRTVVIQPSFENWRERARELLARRVPPDDVLWSDEVLEPVLFPSTDDAFPRGAVPNVPPAFLDLARRVAADRDVRQLQQWGKAIGRDIHKRHAFVRFRLVGTDEATGRGQFVAWFEPEHRIVQLAAGFFEKRFAGVDWSILTPHECAHEDGSRLHFSAGVPRTAPNDDALDDLWRTYYRSIFNPARLKVRAMQSEMPKKYWKNLPEASLIAGLIAESGGRVDQMLRTEVRPVKPAPKNAYLDSLRDLNAPPPPDTPSKNE